MIEKLLNNIEKNNPKNKELNLQTINKSNCIKIIELIDSEYNKIIKENTEMKVFI